MKPEILVLSSGGSKGLAHLGALSFYEMNNQLTNIHTYVGCSIGSMISLLLNVGYKASELAELFSGMASWAAAEGIKLNEATKGRENK